MSTVRVMLAVLTLISSAASASALEGADVSLPGAEARLGWGGGYSSGAWSLLHLRVVGGDAYRLSVATQTGTLRAGLQPLSATLEVSAGAGVREQRLWLPLSTKRPVKLTLSSNLGTTSATVHPLQATTPVAEAMDSPAAYLGRPSIADVLEPQQALIALAGGAVLRNASGLERLPSGALGLGALQRGSTEVTASALDLEQIALSLLRPAPPPGRQSVALAWWCAAAFLVALGVYSARRLEWRFSLGSAGLIAVIGAAGWAALQPSEEASSAERTVLIGAGGWGLKIQLTNRFNASATELRLPSGVQILNPTARQYTRDATLIQAGPWSEVSYWSAPSAARVPLRVIGSTLENSGQATLTDVYVVGSGPLEPLREAQRIFSANNDPSSLESGYTTYGTLLKYLPLGSAVARSGETVVIALPEASAGKP